jgi:hypothetical protein
MSLFAGAFEHRTCSSEVSRYDGALEITESGAFTRSTITVGTRGFTFDHQTRLTGYSERGAVGLLRTRTWPHRSTGDE